MSKHTTFKRVSTIGATFRRLYVSDEGTRSLYITINNRENLDEKFKLNYNYKGNICSYYASTEKVRKITKDFKKRYMVSYLEANSLATELYGMAIRDNRSNIITDGQYTTEFDVVYKAFRVSGNINNLTLAKVTQMIGKGKASLRV